MVLGPEGNSRHPRHRQLHTHPMMPLMKLEVLKPLGYLRKRQVTLGSLQLLSWTLINHQLLLATTWPTLRSIPYYRNSSILSSRSTSLPSVVERTVSASTRSYQMDRSHHVKWPVMDSQQAQLYSLHPLVDLGLYLDLYMKISSRPIGFSTDIF